ncbi:SDR family oxidoreductase [Methylocaldum sp.]|uniref:SDR family oxidoreductase n=1 Tax=Methylocaldum sp. TaxID=1969727 RepID=UPI002D5CDFF3|nr:SDR family oxidoreductase [Methylocaldum sp.]HYE36466.1 SDR family oxidoreductase [Methylocaldum sp.]
MSYRKKALITGSSRGIGKGIALKLAEQGANVAIHYYRNRAAADDTLAEVRKHGTDGFIVQADVSKPAEITRMFDRVRERFEGLDIFVANARPEASEFFYPPLDITPEQWDAAFDSQVKAFLVAAREAVRLMRDGGRIVAITHSPGGRTGSLQPWVAMGSAKAALESLVRYFAVALAKRGITVNAVSPGWIEDSVLNSLPTPAQEAIRRWHTRGWTPMGRLGTPADIGNAVSLLSSEDASWITGQVLFVDGGASLMDPGHPPELQLGWEPEPLRSIPQGHQA